MMKAACVAIICQLYELTREQLKSNPGTEFKTISRMNIVAFVSPNKWTDDDLTLKFWTFLKLPKSKQEKVKDYYRVVLKSTHQVDRQLPN